MANINITSANSSLTLTCSDLSISSTTMEYFSVDNAWTLEDTETAVAQVGVDGKMTVGWVPRLNPLTITFQANSSSADTLHTIVEKQDTDMTVYQIQGVLTCPSISKEYTLSNGVVTRYKAAPNGERVLGELSYTITFESVTVSTTSTTTTTTSTESTSTESTSTESTS